MSKLTVKKDEMEAIMQIAKMKHLDVTIYGTAERLVLRIKSLFAYEDVKNAVSDHTEYIDEFGKSSTSPKGFMMQINKRSKAKLGVASKLTEKEELQALSAIRGAIPRIIAEGEKSSRTRREIKDACYKIIDTMAMIYLGEVYDL